MSFMPKVSIIIPVFNGSDYLSQAINSALDQTYQNTEIIVVNDGSEDNKATEQIALSYGDKIHYYSKVNGGVASALNLAIKKMTGEYFSWLSHDDLYYPEKLEVQISALTDQDRLKTILYSDYAIFGSDSDEIRKIRMPATPPEQFRYFITANNFLHGCTLLVPKTAFEDCGVFDESLRTTQDYDLWFRMAEKYEFVHIPEILVKARSHAEQGTVRLKSHVITECNALLEGFVSRLSEHEMVFARRKSVSLSYAEIASSFKWRGFHQAEKKARSLALNHMRWNMPLEALKTIFILLYTAFVGSISSVLRKMIKGLGFKVKK